VARLPVRLIGDPNTGVATAELAPAIQRCLRASRTRRLAINTIKATIAVGNVFIIVLIRLINLDAGSSAVNKGLLLGILGLSSLVALGLTLAYQFSFERESYRYNSAARALERLRDIYNREHGRTRDSEHAQDLLVWVKQNVNEVERLIDDSRIYDIDLVFRPFELPPVSKDVASPAPALALPPATAKEIIDVPPGLGRRFISLILRRTR